MKTITVNMVKEALCINNTPRIEPGDVVPGELIDLFREYNKKIISQLITPQPPRNIDKKAYKTKVRCSVCKTEQQEVEIFGKDAFMDFLFGHNDRGYVSEDGSFTNIPPKLNWTPLGIFQVNGICYSSINFQSTLCENCRNDYARSLLPKLEEKFHLLRQSIENNDRQYFLEKTVDGTKIYMLKWQK